MKVNQVSNFLDKLNEWHHGTCRIGELETLLGTKHNQLYHFFFENGLCDLKGNPIYESDFVRTFRCLVLYLSLRKTRI